MKPSREAVSARELSGRLAHGRPKRSSDLIDAQTNEASCQAKPNGMDQGLVAALDEPMGKRNAGSEHEQTHHNACRHGELSAPESVEAAQDDGDGDGDRDNPCRSFSWHGTSPGG